MRQYELHHAGNRDGNSFARSHVFESKQTGYENAGCQRTGLVKLIGKLVLSLSVWAEQATRYEAELGIQLSAYHFLEFLVETGAVILHTQIVNPVGLVVD